MPDMLFCEPVYEANLRSDMKKPWADYYEALLSLSKTAVRSDGWELAAFFFASEEMGEYVLGPHWLADDFDAAPFIRRSFTHRLWMEARKSALTGAGETAADPEVFSGPADLRGSRREWLLPLGATLMFYGITGNDDGSTGLYGGEGKCWEELRRSISHPVPDLSVQTPGDPSR